MLPSRPGELAIPADAPARRRQPALTATVVTLLYAVASVLPKGDAGLLAAARTLILVCAALLLAWASRRETWREAGWLVYPILVLVSLKLIVEDFPHGRPATLFVALALVGGAFILAPRLLRRA